MGEPVEKGDMGRAESRSWEAKSQCLWPNT